MTFVRSNLEKQVFSLPQEVKWCKKCLMSNQRPRIFFDKSGICSGCINNNYKKTINWEIREKELIELLDVHRRNDGYWDVLVPSSGGKDSNFVAHMLRHKYKMNPLTVTWSPLKYTNIGWENLQSKIDSGFSNLLCRPNGNFQRKLARLCFEELGDAFHVFVLGQMCYPFHMAAKLGIKLVMYGENGELEYAGDPNYLDKPYRPSDEWVSKYFKGTTFDKLLKFGLENKEYLKESDFCKSDLIFYDPPSQDELQQNGIKGEYFFSYFHKWSPQENYYYASEYTNFKPNPQRTEGTYSKYASIDDKMDGFHYYMRYIKFGLGRCVEDASHEIRDGHIDRNEGLALAKKYEGEFPEKYFSEFLEYLGITEKHFWNVVDSWRLDHLWTKKEKKWILKNQVS
jgi:N-acetyl sugar amidotransferase